MKHLQFLTIVITLSLIFFSCGDKTTEEQHTPEENKVEPLEVEEVKVESSGLDEIKNEIDVLFKHMEVDIQLGKTDLESLKKHYSINEGDQYGNYRVVKSFPNSEVQLKMTFTIEKEKLNYITFQSIEYPEEIKEFLISELKEEKTISENVYNRLDWYKDDYNIVFWDEKSGWTIDIEPKDYNPGF